MLSLGSRSFAARCVQTHACTQTINAKICLVFVWVLGVGGGGLQVKEKHAYLKCLDNCSQAHIW